MENIRYDTILKNSFQNETTRKNYVYRMNTLLRTCYVKSMQPIIESPDAFYHLIRDAYPNITTRKNLLTLILALFKYDKALSAEFPEQHQRWMKLHDDMDGLQTAKYNKNMPDMKQLAKYTPFEDIQLKYNELTKNGENAHLTRQLSQYLVLLSIILNTPPKRADYGCMRIFYDKDPQLSTENYVVIQSSSSSGMGGYMVFTKYKTDKKHMRIDESMNAQLFRDITTSLRRWPRDHLFVTKSSKPFASNNAFSKYVISAFKTLFGKDTGVTMLRHIFITEKVDMNLLSIEEKSEIAQQMMHTSGLQEKYKWNKNAVCSTLKQICKS